MQVRHKKLVAFRKNKLIEQKPVSGQIEYQLGVELINTSIPNNQVIGAQLLEKAVAKGFSEAKAMLAGLLIGGAQGVTQDCMRAYNLIVDTAASSEIINTKYMLAFLILTAKEINYSAAEATKLVNAHEPWRENTTENAAAHILLEKPEVLNRLKDYDTDAGRIYAMGLLAICSTKFPPAAKLLKRFQRNDPAVLAKPVKNPESSFLPAKEPAFFPRAQEPRGKWRAGLREVKHQDVSSKGQVVTPAATKSTDLLSALQKVYDIVYHHEMPTETEVAVLIQEVKDMKTAPRSEAFWKIIREGFTSGRGGDFFLEFKKWALSAMLFPPVFTELPSEELQERGRQSDEWLQARLKLVDQRFREGAPYEPRGAYILLMTKELWPGASNKDIERVRAAYQIPMLFDELESRVKYTLGRKKMYLDEFQPAIEMESDVQAGVRKTF